MDNFGNFCGWFRPSGIDVEGKRYSTLEIDFRCGRRYLQFFCHSRRLPQQRRKFYLSTIRLLLLDSHPKYPNIRAQSLIFILRQRNQQSRHPTHQRLFHQMCERLVTLPAIRNILTLNLKMIEISLYYEKSEPVDEVGRWENAVVTGN